MGPSGLIDYPGLATLWRAIPEARIVGGAVRDQLAGRGIADIDLASPLPPDAVVARLEAAGLRAIPTGLAHGTITALVGAQSFEITTLRRDVETDGRHAVIAFIDDWREDAARRDFTINAMSIDRAGTLHDYFGGAADLAAGIVRFVGDPALRITEDYLRILRFFRFFARYASAAPDPAALAAIRALHPGLVQLSAERVWQEIKKILAAPDPCGALHLMRDTGVLAAILPEAGLLGGLEDMIAAGAPADPLLRFAGLVMVDPALAARLKLSEAERSRLALIQAAPLLGADADDAVLRRALADWTAESLIDRIWLAGGVEYAALRARLAAMARPVFPLKGRDVLALGVAPGPAVGELLAALRAWWLEHGCVAGREEMRRRLDMLVRSHRG
ncbi:MULTISPECIES: CCA tRNA nucleotidyltransferase [Acidiphilium]|uniref:Poly(A) polymerase/tRNA nucleotidyltransferase (CCA-adding enzyme) n=1 Tax=Acidiphilium rubrum TaxID=526 RepID=A0A8G2FEI8_ACIRU|nr:MULTISPECIES: CCA tRNA nucleotidyltransferase [Acidiphilium]SIR31014.1 poly(A) polymerase/tRNA nucleotidyltransferase (CCA-adding enzyme) [Acidiphilium rubrum]